MARFTKTQKEEKLSQVKQMYCKGFDAQTISDIMGDVEVSTVERWIKDNNFENNKRSQIIALSEIRNSILESYAAVLDGGTPKITALQAVNYANAFEKFSSKKQVLTYMFEAYEMLCEEYMTDIQKEPGRKVKDEILKELQGVRSRMDRVLTRLTNEVIGNE